MIVMSDIDVIDHLTCHVLNYADDVRIHDSGELDSHR